RSWLSRYTLPTQPAVRRSALRAGSEGKSERDRVGYRLPLIHLGHWLQSPSQPLTLASVLERPSLDAQQSQMHLNRLGLPSLPLPSASRWRLPRTWGEEKSGRLPESARGAPRLLGPCPARGHYSARTTTLRSRAPVPANRTY